MKNLVFCLAAIWISLLATSPSEALPPAPFVVQGSTVTTPATGSFPHTSFQDPANPYTVIIAPSSGTLTLTNNDTIVASGNGSTLTISAVSTLNDTNAGTDVAQLGSGTVTNAGTINGGAHGINLLGDGAVTNSGAILNGNAGIIIQGSGTVTNTSAGSISTNGRSVQIFGDGTVINAGSITATQQAAVQIEGLATVTNSGFIAGGNGIGIELDGSAASTVTNTATGSISGVNGVSINNDNAVEDTSTVTNAGLIAGTADGVSMTGSGILINSGTITAQSGGFNSAAVLIAETGTVTNTGTISDTQGGGVALLINGIGTINNASNATITGGAIGIQVGSSGTVTNGGTINGTSNAGVFLGETGTVMNSGTITGANGITVGIMGSVINLSGGVITGTDNGIRLAAGTVTNYGSISGTGLASDGIFAASNAVVTLVNGSVSGVHDAIETNEGGGASSSITVIGRTAITGALVEDEGIGTLRLDLVGLTPAEAAALQAQAGRTSGSITIGGQTYSWTNFTLIDNSVSLETVVDPGLRDIALKIDGHGQSLSAAFDPFYVAAANNPEGALNSLVGREFDNAFSVIGLSNATAFSDLADNRDFTLRSGTGGFDLSGLSLTTSSMIASLGQTQDILAKLGGSGVMGGTTMSDSKEQVAPANEIPRWGAWASGTVMVADASTTFATPGFQFTTGSPTIGADYRVSRELAVGALAEYSTTGANFGDGSRLGVQNELLGAYGTWTHHSWYVNGLVGGGLDQYHDQRNTLAGSQAQSAPSGNEILANLTGGYDFQLGGGWRVSPEIGLQYTHLEQDGFAESGAGAFDLNVEQQDVDSLRTKLGFRVADNFEWDGIRFTPQVHAAWYHECLDDSRGVSTSLAGAPALGSFIIGTDQPERDYGLVGAGLSATPSELHDSVTFFVDYDAQVGQSDFSAQTFNGGVRIGF